MSDTSEIERNMEALTGLISEIGFKILKELKTANKLKALEIYVTSIDKNYSFEKFNVRDYLQAIFLNDS